MPAPALKVSVLLGLLGAEVDGFALRDRLSSIGVVTSPGRLLPALMSLENAGLIAVDRSGPAPLYSLTSRGTESAYAIGPGKPVPTTLVMADLAGFTSFTAREGDNAARSVAIQMERDVAATLASTGGRLVKCLGDGILGIMGPVPDPVEVVRTVARQARVWEGNHWSLHAAVHEGSPIHHNGDLYGQDVNLVSRLCQMAAAGEVLLTVREGGETVDLRGFDHPVLVRRVAL